MAELLSTEVVSTTDLLALARFRILDQRNCNEEAKDRLLVIMADEIERLVKARDRDHEQAWMNGAAALRAQAEIERLQKILRDWGICGWERSSPDVQAPLVCKCETPAPTFSGDTNFCGRCGSRVTRG